MRSALLPGGALILASCVSLAESRSLPQEGILTTFRWFSASAPAVKVL